MKDEMNSGQPNQEKQQSSITNESVAKGVSRRDFLRKSAEVACLSLFGLLSFDSVVDRVVDAMGEHKAIKQVGKAVADELPGGLSATVDCTEGGDVTCTGGFAPNCRLKNPYGCTTRILTCDTRFDCGVKYSCRTLDMHKCIGNYGCPVGFRWAC